MTATAATTRVFELRKRPLVASLTMKARTWLCGVGAAVAIAGIVGGALVGCASPEAKFASVKAGELPAGQAWPGVYYNPVYGYLHLVGQEGSLVGRWKRTDSSHWGEMSGTVEGNVMHFTWREHRYGVVGPSGESHGSGVFVYKLPAVEQAIAELDGQYSLDESSDIGQWHCVKQVGMKPDLNSITGESPVDAPAVHDKWQ